MAVEVLDLDRLKRMCPAGLGDPLLTEYAERNTWEETPVRNSDWTDVDMDSLAPVKRYDYYGAAADAWEDRAVEVMTKMEEAADAVHAPVVTSKSTGNQTVSFSTEQDTALTRAARIRTVRLMARQYRSRARAKSVPVTPDVVRRVSAIEVIS